jgi:hypothetical protein
MSLPGPILVVSDRHDRKLSTALAAAGAYPIIETTLAGAAAAIGEAEPAAVLFAEPDPAPVQSLADALMDAIEAMPAPFMPVVARVNDCGPTILDVLPINAAAPLDQVIARLAAALRVRTLHATVLRRIDTLRHNGADVPALPFTDPLDDATILVTGRGRTYPALTAAVSERVGLIGALSVENAARLLNTRDVDGVILGEGFGPSTNEAFLTALMQDSRFRDLPIGVVAEIPAGIDRGRLCGLEPVAGEPEDIVAHLLPLVRVHAFGMRLRRHVAALDARGMIDPQTGLLTISAFERDLPRAITHARKRKMPMSMARFRLPEGLCPRARADAARVASRLIQPGDFACQEGDGAIVVVFAQSALRQSHVVTRRIAAAMRQTVLEPEGSGFEAMVTLACLKPADTVQSLVERVCEDTVAAAE